MFCTFLLRKSSYDFGFVFESGIMDSDVPPNPQRVLPLAAVDIHGCPGTGIQGLAVLVLKDHSSSRAQRG